MAGLSLHNETGKLITVELEVLTELVYDSEPTESEETHQACKRRRMMREVPSLST